MGLSMSKCERNIAFIAVILTALLLPLAAPLLGNVSVMGQGVVKYAEKVKYPLPSIPEPVLVKGIIKVLVREEKDAAGFKAYLTAKILPAPIELKLVGSEYNAKKGIWTLKFKLPEAVKPGLYDLILEYSIAGKTVKINEPRSVWVLAKWPRKLRILLSGDTKTPGGKPYYFTFVKIASLLKPDLLIFDGDEVERPDITSAWVQFLQGLKAFTMPTYMVIGNHEYEKLGSAKIYESILGYRNYSITIGKFLIIALDTGSEGVGVEYDRFLSQLKWAERVLKENKDKVKILVLHHPLLHVWKESPRTTVKAYYKVSSPEDLEKLNRQYRLIYRYSLWIKDGKITEAAKKLFELILKYDVRIIQTAHTHTDSDIVIIDAQGRKHYFLTITAVAYDVRKYDIRGFKIIEIYDDGRVNEKTITYAGRKLGEYPTSIPIDWPGEGMYPYKLGTIEYYYAPANDGTRHAVSFIARNMLNQTFKNIYIEFVLPKDKPFSAYKWYPHPPPAFKVFEGKDKIYVRVYNVTLPAKGVVYYTLAAVSDETPPSILEVRNVSIVVKKWSILRVKVKDSGWGVKDIYVEYSFDNVTWYKADLIDLNDEDTIKTDFETVAFLVWIKNEGKLPVTIKVKAVDFAGNEASKTVVFKRKAPVKPAVKKAKAFRISPILLAVIVVIIIAVCIAIILVVRRRRH